MFLLLPIEPLVPYELIDWAAIRIELRGAELLPEREGGQVFVESPPDVVGLVVCVTGLEEPAFDLMLQVQAVFPGVEAARILIQPFDALAEVGKWTKRRSGGGEETAVEGIGEGVVRGKEVVLCGDEGGAAAETVLA